MRQVIACVVMAALLAAAGRSAAPHVHAYVDHDHPEHHHGLALHDHSRGEHDEPGPAAHLSSCTPGEHAVVFQAVYDVISAMVVLGPTEPRYTPDTPLVVTTGHAPEPDSRAHGPPARSDAPPRAPPSISPA